MIAGVFGPATDAFIVGSLYSSTLNDCWVHKRLVAAHQLDVVIAHRRALGRGPFGLGDAIGVDRQRQVELRVRPRMAQPQDAGEARRQREAGPGLAAQDVLHVDRLALPDERAVEHGVEDVVAAAVAIGQVEIVGPDALAPLRHAQS